MESNHPEGEGYAILTVQLFADDHPVKISHDINQWDYVLDKNVYAEQDRATPFL